MKHIWLVFHTRRIHRVHITLRTYFTRRALRHERLPHLRAWMPSSSGSTADAGILITGACEVGLKPMLRGTFLALGRKLNRQVD
jgi:hypothetical protein